MLQCAAVCWNPAIDEVLRCVAVFRCVAVCWDVTTDEVLQCVASVL